MGACCRSGLHRVWLTAIDMIEAEHVHSSCHGLHLAQCRLTDLSLYRYGDWTAQTEVAPILGEFLNSLGGTSWMNINTAYYDSQGNTGTTQLSHGGTCFDPYSHGKSLSDADVLVSVLMPCS